MKRVIFFTFSLWIFAACSNSGGGGGTSESIPAPFNDDQVLASYKSDFYNLAKQETGQDISKETIPIRFSALGYTPETGGTNGMCRVYTNGAGELLARFVEIDSIYFNRAPEGQKRELVLHEMGHCSLRRPHRTDSFDGVPLSIMYPVTLSNSLFLGRFQTYISELFSNSYVLNAQAEQLFSVPKGTMASISAGFNTDDEIYVIEIESITDSAGKTNCKSQKRRIR